MSNNDMKRYMKLLESASNPMDVQVKELDDSKTVAELVLRDEQVEGRFEETEEGKFRFKSNSENFSEYEGIEFDDLQAAEDFFIDMTQNDEFYEK